MARAKRRRRRLPAMLGFLGACLLLLLGLMGVIPGSNLADSQWLQ